MKLAVFVMAAMLAACQTKPALRVDPAPKIVRVHVPVYVPMPPELNADCYNERAREQTYGESLRLANLRDASIAECNARAAKRRELERKAAGK